MKKIRFRLPMTFYMPSPNTPIENRHVGIYKK